MSEYYVYSLVGPRTSERFYVGKGKGKRAWQHAIEVKTGRVNNVAKTERIREIHAAGKEPTVKFEARWLSEDEALDFEEELIAELPGLTNVLPRGGPGATFSLRAWLKRVEKWPNGPTFPGMYNGDIEAHNFVVQVRKLLQECDERKSGSRKPSQTESVTSWLTGPVSGPFACQTSFLP